MDLIEKYLTRIQKSKKRTHLYICDDVLLLTVRRKTREWGKPSVMKRNFKKETVILVLSYDVKRFECIDSNYQPYLNKIHAKIKYGSIKSHSDIVEALGKYRTPYGTACIRLSSTKLEYYL